MPEAQSVEHETLDFGSGHDLVVCGFKRWVRLCAESTDPVWDSLSHSLSLPLPCSCVHGFSRNKYTLKTKQNTHTQRGHKLVKLLNFKRSRILFAPGYSHRVSDFHEVSENSQRPVQSSSEETEAKRFIHTQTLFKKCKLGEVLLYTITQRILLSCVLLE